MEGQWRWSSEAPEILGEVRDAIAETAGPDLLGLYLYGSLVSGGFDSKVSDVDLIAVLADDPSEDLVSRLGLMHDALAVKHPEWADRVEVVYVSAGRLRKWNEGIPRMAVISPGEPFHVVKADPDWVLAWYPAREEAVALRGPALRELIPEIEPAEFLSAVRGRLNDLGEGCADDASPGACAYAILTMCRGLLTLRTGSRPSKLEAAEWAAGEYPEWADDISAALQWRQRQWEVQASDPEVVDRTRKCLSVMIEDSALS